MVNQSKILFSRHILTETLRKQITIFFHIFNMIKILKETMQLEPEPKSEKFYL
jgi:hypothetical protein